MKKEDYPERIYCMIEDVQRKIGHFAEKPVFPKGKDIKYIRADLFPQWHDADKELPQLDANGYSDMVLIRDTMGDIGTGWRNKKDWCSSDDSMMIFKIVAWCPIPKQNN